MSGRATKALTEFISERGIKGIAISRATGISVNILYPCLKGEREMRADEFMKVCEFVQADPMELYKSATE